MMNQVGRIEIYAGSFAGNLKTKNPKLLLTKDLFDLTGAQKRF